MLRPAIIWELVNGLWMFRYLTDRYLYMFATYTCSQCSAEAAFLRHCPTNFENDAAKTVPVGHLAYTDFWRGAVFESVSYVEYSHAKK